MVYGIGLPSGSHFWMMVPLQPSFFGGFSIATLWLPEGIRPWKKQLGSPPKKEKKNLLKWPQGPPKKPSTVRVVAMPPVLMCGKKTHPSNVFLGWNSSRIMIPGMYLTCYIWLSGSRNHGVIWCNQCNPRNMNGTSRSCIIYYSKPKKDKNSKILLTKMVNDMFFSFFFIFGGSL